MAEDQVVLTLKLLDEFSANLDKFKRELGTAKDKTEQETSRMAGGFDRVKVALGALGASALFAGFLQGLRKVVDAAAEAEQMQVKLAAALKATGNYSADAVLGINQWANAMLQSKGISDELAVSLVAEGVAMGKTIEQAKRLAEAAANMAPITGSLESAFSMLIRASNGSTEALKRYGVQVTEAEAKSGDFEAVLQRIEKQFEGQAEAALKTYNGQVNLLSENFGNLAESIGNEVLPAINEMLGSINKSISDYQRLNAAVADLDKTELLRLRNQLAAKEIALQGGLISFGGGNLGDIQEKIRQVDAALIKLATTARAAREAGGGLLDGGKFAPTRAADAEKVAKGEKKVTDEAAKQVRYFEAIGAAEARRIALLERYLEALRAWRAEGEYTPIDEIRAAQDEDILARVEAEAQARADANQQLLDDEEDQRLRMEEKLARERREGYMDAAVEEFKLREMLQQNLIQDFTTLTIGALRMALNGAPAAEIVQHLGAGIGAIVGAAIAAYYTNGNAGAMAGGAQAGGLIGQVIGNLFGLGPNTPAQNTRERLGRAIYGLTGEYGDTERITEEEYFGSGKADLWADWTDAITGATDAGTTGGRMLMAVFDDLGYSMYDQADIVGDLIALNQDLSAAEADRLAAETALLANVRLERKEIEDLVRLRGQANARIDEEERLREEYFQKADEAYAAELRGDQTAYNAAITRMLEINARRVEMMAQDEQHRRENEERIREDLRNRGMTDEQIDEALTRDAGIERNTADMLLTMREIRDLLAADDPPAGDVGAPLLHGGRDRTALLNGRGGGNLTVVVNGAVGNHRDIAKNLHAELKKLRAYGEVN